MSMNIFYVNINGLNDQKLKQIDVHKDFRNADIICLTETHLRYEIEFPKIDNYDQAYHAVVDRKNYMGRNIKGISTYIKESTTEQSLKK